MRRMELKRMRKRILRMWMKKKVVMRMMVSMISIWRMGGLGEINNRGSSSSKLFDYEIYFLKCYFN